MHQREPDAGPFLRARPRAGDAVESVEDVRQLVRGDPDARVGDRELDLPAASGQRHAHLPLEGELQGVRDQVQQDLLPHVRIDQDRVRQRLRS